ncbi:MAG: lasso peptide biosynthesis B2 protein [bacterium]
MKAFREHTAVALMLGASTLVVRLATIEQAASLGNDFEFLRTVEPDRAVAVITRLAKYMPGASCIPQAITCRAWLALGGHPADIVIGFHHRGYWQGHAWVETNTGERLFLPEQSPFRETLRL